jgi:hypothetical protein
MFFLGLGFRGVMGRVVAARIVSDRMSESRLIAVRPFTLGVAMPRMIMSVFVSNGVRPKIGSPERALRRKGHSMELRGRNTETLGHLARR